jgi:hypothetical protein
VVGEEEASREEQNMSPSGLSEPMNGVSVEEADHEQQRVLEEKRAKNNESKRKSRAKQRTEILKSKGINAQDGLLSVAEFFAHFGHGHLTRSAVIDYFKQKQELVVSAKEAVKSFEVFSLFVFLSYLFCLYFSVFFYSVFCFLLFCFLLIMSLVFAGQQRAGRGRAGRGRAGRGLRLRQRAWHGGVQ